MIAFIFVRKNSTRLKNKNLRLINGKPLFYHSIKIAKKIKEIKHIYVSTDSEKIIKLSKKYGVGVIKRPRNLTKTDSIEYLSWKHAIYELEKRNIKFKKFISIPSTAPLRNERDIYKCIKKLKDNNQIVVTAYESPTDPREIKISKSKEGIYFMEKKKTKKTIKQNKVYNLTTIAYVTTTDYIKKNNKLFDGKVSVVKIPKIRAIDINDENDFKIAKFLMKK